jgi:hypothetical protein
MKMTKYANETRELRDTKLVRNGSKMNKFDGRAGSQKWLQDVQYPESSNALICLHTAVSTRSSVLVTFITGTADLKTMEHT